jgi:hypothetical protein
LAEKAAGGERREAGMAGLLMWRPMRFGQAAE